MGFFSFLKNLWRRFKSLFTSSVNIEINNVESEKASPEQEFKDFLNNQIKELKEKNSTLEKAQREEQRRADGLESQLKNEQDRYSSTKNKLLELERSFEEKKDSEHKLNIQLDDKREKLLSAENKLREAEKQAETHELSSDKYRRENNNLINALKDSQNLVDSLKERAIHLTNAQYVGSDFEEQVLGLFHETLSHYSGDIEFQSSCNFELDTTEGDEDDGKNQELDFLVTFKSDIGKNLNIGIECKSVIDKGENEEDKPYIRRWTNQQQLGLKQLTKYMKGYKDKGDSLDIGILVLPKPRYPVSNTVFVKDEVGVRNKKIITIYNPEQVVPTILGWYALWLEQQAYLDAIPAGEREWADCRDEFENDLVSKIGDKVERGIFHFRDARKNLEQALKKMDSADRSLWSGSANVKERIKSTFDSFLRKKDKLPVSTSDSVDLKNKKMEDSEPEQFTP